MIDATHSAVMKRGDLEEVPYADSDYISTHVQLSDVSSSSKAKFLPAFFATLVVALGPFNFGFALGYSAPVEPNMAKTSSKVYLDKSDFSWFAVCVLFVEIICCKFPKWIIVRNKDLLTSKTKARDPSCYQVIFSVERLSRVPLCLLLIWKHLEICLQLL